MLNLLLCHLLQLIPHDKLQLPDGHRHKRHGHGNLDQADLGVQLHQAHTRRPAERLPGVEHADGAGAAEDLGLDFAAKDAVEGNDGLVLLGEHGRLDAGETDGSGEDDEDGHEEAGDGDEEKLLHDLLAGCLVTVTEVGGILLVAVEAEGLEEGDGHIERNLLRDGPDGSGENDVAGAFDGGDTVVPAGGGRGTDDNVCPGHLEAA